MEIKFNTKEVLAVRNDNNIFGFDAELIKTDTKDPETGATRKGLKKIIKVHKFGKTIQVRDGNGYIDVDAMCYLVPADEDIEKGDKLDGQPVRVVNKYTKPKGRRRRAIEKLLEIYTYA